MDLSGDDTGEVSVCVGCLLLFRLWHFEFVEPQTLSFSIKLGASVALLCEQYKKTKASMEAAPFQSVPKRTPVKAVPGCLRNRAPPRSKGTPLQQAATWRPEKHRGATTHSTVQRIGL